MGEILRIVWVRRLKAYWPGKWPSCGGTAPDGRYCYRSLIMVCHGTMGKTLYCLGNETVAARDRWPCRFCSDNGRYPQYP